MDYETVRKRRAAFGAGLVELHNKHGCGRSGPYGIGLWCQNRPEWQITGTVYSPLLLRLLTQDVPGR
jgi:long-chain acyl-CoA synthetase